MFVNCTPPTLKLYISVIAYGGDITKLRADSQTVSIKMKRRMMIYAGSTLFAKVFVLVCRAEKAKFHTGFISGRFIGESI